MSCRQFTLTTSRHPGDPTQPTQPDPKSTLYNPHGRGTRAVGPRNRGGAAAPRSCAAFAVRVVRRSERGYAHTLTHAPTTQRAPKGIVLKILYHGVDTAVFPRAPSLLKFCNWIKCSSSVWQHGSSRPCCIASVPL